MKVKLIGFFSSMVWLIFVLGILQWAQWIDTRSAIFIGITTQTVLLLDSVCRWLWKRRHQKGGNVSEKQKKFDYSSFELSGYLAMDAVCWLKQKTRQLLGSTRKKKE